MCRFLISIMSMFNLSFAEKIKIIDVDVLTLKIGQFTTGNRMAPIQQLKCRGLYCKYKPDTIRCSNDGYDGNDVNWNCKANLDKSVKFGNLNIQCEGFEYPYDPYILIGSCGLEYNLEAKESCDLTQSCKPINSTYDSNTKSPNIFICAIIIIIVCVCLSNTLNFTDGFWLGYFLNSIADSERDNTSWIDYSTGFATTTRR